MAEPWILAVDLGTGGPKTGAVTLSGELLAVAHRGVATSFSDDGGAVQDPHAWWDGIREGVAEVLSHGVTAADAALAVITAPGLPLALGLPARVAVRAIAQPVRDRLRPVLPRRRDV
jgi:hypothetical protein